MCCWASNAPMSEHCIFFALLCGLAGAHSHISFLLLHDRGGHSHAPCSSSPGISPKSTRLSLARPHGASHIGVRTGHRQGCALAPTPMLEFHSSRSGIALTPFFQPSIFPQTAERPPTSTASAKTHSVDRSGRRLHPHRRHRNMGVAGLPRRGPRPFEAKVKLLDVSPRGSHLAMFLFWGLPLSQPSLTAAAILLLLVAALDASALPVNIAAGAARSPSVGTPFCTADCCADPAASSQQPAASMNSQTLTADQEAQGEIGTCGSRKVMVVQSRQPQLPTHFSIPVHVRPTHPRPPGKPQRCSDGKRHCGLLVVLDPPPSLSCPSRVSGRARVAIRPVVSKGSWWRLSSARIEREGCIERIT